MLTFMEFSEFVIYMRKLFAGIENIARTKFGFSADYNHARICVFQNHPSVHCDIPDILSVLRHDKNRQIIFVSLSFLPMQSKHCASIKIHKQSWLTENFYCRWPKKQG